MHSWIIPTFPRNHLLPYKALEKLLNLRVQENFPHNLRDAGLMNHSSMSLPNIATQALSFNMNFFQRAAIERDYGKILEDIDKMQRVHENRRENHKLSAIMLHIKVIIINLQSIEKRDHVIAKERKRCTQEYEEAVEKPR